MRDMFLGATVENVEVFERFSYADTGAKTPNEHRRIVMSAHLDDFKQLRLVLEGNFGRAATVNSTSVKRLYQTKDRKKELENVKAFHGGHFQSLVIPDVNAQKNVPMLGPEFAARAMELQRQFHQRNNPDDGRRAILEVVKEQIDTCEVADVDPRVKKQHIVWKGFIIPPRRKTDGSGAVLVNANKTKIYREIVNLLINNTLFPTIDYIPHTQQEYENFVQRSKDLGRNKSTITSDKSRLKMARALVQRSLILDDDERRNKVYGTSDEGVSFQFYCAEDQSANIEALNLRDWAKLQVQNP
jgi:hypothetical protein